MPGDPVPLVTEVADVAGESPADQAWRMLCLGRTAAAAPLAEQGVERAQGHGGDDEARALAGLAGARRQQHRDDEAVTLAQRALALTRDPVLRGRAVVALAEVHLQRGFHVMARESIEQALADLEPACDSSLRERVRLLNNLGRSCFELCDYPQAKDAFGQAYDLSERLDDSRSMATTAMNIGNVRSQLGDYAGALDAYRRAQAHCGDTGPNDMYAVVQYNLACVYESLDELDTAAELCRDALEVDLDEDVNGIRPFLTSLLGRTMRRQGDHAGARAPIDEALVHFRESGDRGHEASALAELGDLRLAEGDVEAARASYEQGLATLGELLVPVAEVACRQGLARVRLARGEAGEALEILADLLANPGEVPDRRCHVDLLRDRAAALRMADRNEEAQQAEAESERLSRPGERDPRIEQLMMHHRLQRARVREQRLAHRVDEQSAALVEAQRERTDLQERLRRAQRMEAVGRLAGGVAHDFNNLLTVMRQHGERLLELLPEGGGDHAEALGVMNAAQRASALTAQLLAISREQALRPSRLDLSQVVNEMAPVLTELLGAAGTLSFELDDRAGTVLADRVQIDQILLNLVANARDAVGPSGQVTVTVGARRVGQGGEACAVDELNAGDYVSLSVTDDGEGVPVRWQGRMFEPFFTTKGEGRGTGLGLSTVWGIARQSGGGVSVRSEPGRGCTIEVLLPRVDGIADALQPSTEAPHVEADEGGRTVLLVEDEGGLRRLIARGLRRNGFEVLEAADGVEAVETLSGTDQHVSVVVSDVMMPRLGGHEMLIRLRAIRPGLHCIFTSGFPDGGNMASGPEVSFLPKPFGIAELVLRVGEVATRAR